MKKERSQGMKKERTPRRMEKKMTPRDGKGKDYKG